MTNEKISVVMGVYNSNHEKLTNAIQSILNQSYQNIEFVICDDGSTNGTYEIVRQLQKADERIVLIRNDSNCGLAKSLNRCLSKASGKYIARQDDDDLSQKRRLEIEINFLDQHPEFDFVGCAMDLFDESGKWGLSRLKETPHKEDFLFGVPFSHPTILARREAYEKCSGYRVAEETVRTEDYDLFMRMYSVGLRGYNLQESLYEYYQDHLSLKRPKWNRYVNEFKIRYHGFKSLKLFPVGYVYLLKPFVSAALPTFMRKQIYSARFQKNEGECK